MRRLSGWFGVRRLIAVAAAGALLSAGLGAAAASAADQTPGAAAGPPATRVSLSPCGIKYTAGSLYIGAYDAVYKVGERAGTLTSIAPGFAFEQIFAEACGVAVDAAGNVLVADEDRVVAVAAKTGTFYGKKMVARHVYPIATGFDSVEGAADVQVDRSGNVLIAVGGSPSSHTDYEIDSQIFVLAEHTGTLYGKKMIKGKSYVIAGVRNGGGPYPPPFAPAAGARTKAQSDGGTRAAQANLGYTIGTLRFDAAGNIILAEGGGDGGGPLGGNHVPPRVAVIPARTGVYYGQKMTVGYIYTIAGLGTKTGSGGPAIDSHLDAVSAVALDQAGNVLVAAVNNGYPRGGIRVIAVRTGTFYGQHMRKGDIYALPGLVGASSVAVDNAGNVLAGEEGYDLVQMLAVKTGAYYGVKARAGRVYTIAGNGRLPVL